MDKDRIAGSAEQAKGKVKEVSGKVAGDAKLEALCFGRELLVPIALAVLAISSG
jgi:hypothetical protein